MASLELSEITVERGGRPVVKDVSISVPAGQVTALLGPNGAGKSSLVLAVGGVLRPRPGSVSLDGLELVLKGGQVGSEDFFDAVRATQRAAD